MQTTTATFSGKLFTANVDKDADGLYRTFWTATDGSKLVDSYRSADRERAESLMHGTAYVALHAPDTLSAAFSRDEYETRCAAAGLSPMSDDDIVAAAYGLTYAQHNLRTDTTGQTIVRQQLAVRRLAQIEADAAANRPTLAAVEHVACPGCGVETPRSLMMSASLGTVCPECYDRWS